MDDIVVLHDSGKRSPCATAMRRFDRDVSAIEAEAIRAVQNAATVARRAFSRYHARLLVDEKDEEARKAMHDLVRRAASRTLVLQSVDLERMYHSMRQCEVCDEIAPESEFVFQVNCTHSHCAACVKRYYRATGKSRCMTCRTPVCQYIALKRCGERYHWSTWHPDPVGAVAAAAAAAVVATATVTADNESNDSEADVETDEILYYDIQDILNQAFSIRVSRGPRARLPLQRVIVENQPTDVSTPTTVL